MRTRRNTVSSALSFMDCICCAFGAVLLLFILTAKKHHHTTNERQKVTDATRVELKESIQAVQAQIIQLQQQIKGTAQDESQGAELLQLLAAKKRLKNVIQQSQAQLLALNQKRPEKAATFNTLQPRTAADPRYLSDLQLKGPHIAIILESSGSMLAGNVPAVLAQMQQPRSSSKKWLRAKSIVRTIIASIPPKNQCTVLSMQLATKQISGHSGTAYIDPYHAKSVANTLKKIDQIEPRGGANLKAAMQAIAQLEPRPSSVLLITDGLPTAPAKSNSKLSETDRVNLFIEATRACPDLPFNVLLLPFAGDPTAAGLYWQLSGQKNGVCLVPAADWPSQEVDMTKVNLSQK